MFLNSVFTRRRAVMGQVPPRGRPGDPLGAPAAGDDPGWGHAWRAHDGHGSSTLLAPAAFIPGRGRQRTADSETGGYSGI